MPCVNHSIKVPDELETMADQVHKDLRQCIAFCFGDSPKSTQIKIWSAGCSRLSDSAPNLAWKWSKTLPNRLKMTKNGVFGFSLWVRMWLKMRGWIQCPKLTINLERKKCTAHSQCEFKTMREMLGSLTSFLKALWSFLWRTTYLKSYFILLTFSNMRCVRHQISRAEYTTGCFIKLDRTWLF